MTQPLEDFIEGELDTLGFDLVEFRRGGTSRNPVLDVRMDRRDGAKVSLEDCAHVSRALEPRLDASGLVGDAYVLEVSSPGAERLLRRPADWTRFTGRRVIVNSPALGGRMEGDIVGWDDVFPEEEAGRRRVIIRDLHGVEHRVALEEIATARLALVWNK